MQDESGLSPSYSGMGQTAPERILSQRNSTPRCPKKEIPDVNERKKMSSNVGLLPGYQGGHKSKPRAILEKLVERTKLKTTLEILRVQINEGVSSLNPAELSKLQRLLAAETQSVDADAGALRQQVQEESRLAKTTKPLNVRIPRKAAAALALEVERRVERGHYPNASELVGAAVVALYGGRL
jgi:hypothetical protein